MTRSAVLRCAVVALCVWHMAAIGLFAFPGGMSAAVDDLKTVSNPAVRPYVLLLSQWQQWNLFSPDPLRRITSYRIDDTEAPRRILERIASGSYPWYVHSTWFKYFTGLIDDDSERARPLQERFLAQACARFRLPEGHRLELILERVVLPKHRHVENAAYWRAADFPLTKISVASHICP